MKLNPQLIKKTNSAKDYSPENILNLLECKHRNG